MAPTSIVGGGSSCAVEVVLLFCAGGLRITVVAALTRAGRVSGRLGT